MSLRAALPSPAFRHDAPVRCPSEPTHACPQCAHAENDWRGGNGYVRRQAVAIIFLKYACQQRRANQFHDNVNIAFWRRFHNGCESQFMFVLAVR